MIKIRRPETCVGCLICEMACSFHHTRTFSRSRSSITVNKDISSGRKKVQIAICHEKGNGFPMCDLCEGEDSKLCITLCPQNVFKLERRKA
ncbi:MAG: hypothetical protein HQ561_08505 [Desulfobacteraceae bacterium]|nr:hypothetical protein [Desulfobacteraceae bacterium]